MLINEQALDDLAWAAKRFKGVLELIPALDELRKYDLVINEKKVLLAKLTKEIDDVGDQYAEELQAFDTLRTELDQYKDESKTEADRLVKDAVDRANEMLAEAKNKITVSFAEAEKQAKEVYETIEKGKQEVLVVQGRIKDEQEKLFALKQEIAALKAKFNQ